jgi:uncharacterized damage-inducible protein DinB
MEVPMINYTGKDLARSFRDVRGNTITIAEEIPAEKYTFQAAPEMRNVGRLLAHIALGPRFQLTAHRSRVVDITTINFAEVIASATAEEAKPRTKAEIVELLRTEGEAYASFLDGVTDAFLAERVTMPPGAQPATKSRFEMLMSPKEHEMHHRGQLMLVQRMIGLVPHLTRRQQERMAQTRG